MPTIERDGATIYYEVSGEGRAVVLGHSLLCDGRMWEGVVPILARRYRVINVDFRGHRHSTAPAPFTLEDLAEDWRAVLYQEKVERAALCGLSMGGMTAMRLALAAPERVAGIVALDSNGAREGLLSRLKYRMMAAIYRRFGLVGMLRRSVSKLMFGRTRRLREQGVRGCEAPAQGMR